MALSAALCAALLGTLCVSTAAYPIEDKGLYKDFPAMEEYGMEDTADPFEDEAAADEDFFDVYAQLDDVNKNGVITATYPVDPQGTEAFNALQVIPGPEDETFVEARSRGRPFRSHAYCIGWGSAKRCYRFNCRYISNRLRCIRVPSGK